MFQFVGDFPFHNIINLMDASRKQEKIQERLYEIHEIARYCSVNAAIIELSYDIVFDVFDHASGLGLLHSLLDSPKCRKEGLEGALLVALYKGDVSLAQRLVHRGAELTWYIKNFLGTHGQTSSYKCMVLIFGPKVITEELLWATVLNPCSGLTRYVLEVNFRASQAN